MGGKASAFQLINESERCLYNCPGYTKSVEYSKPATFSFSCTAFCPSTMGEKNEKKIALNAFLTNWLQFAKKKTFTNKNLVWTFFYSNRKSLS